MKCYCANIVALGNVPSSGVSSSLNFEGRESFISLPEKIDLAIVEIISLSS